MNRSSKVFSVILLAGVCGLALAAKGGKGSVDADVNFLAWGAIDTDTTCVNAISSGTNFLGCTGNDGAVVEFTLGQYFYDNVDFAGTCFGGSQRNPNAPTFGGTIQMIDDPHGSDMATFRFWALNAAGDTEIQYELSVWETHPSWSNGFPPAVGQTTTLVAPHWSLGSYKRDEKYGPCLGDGTLSGEDVVVVDITRLN